jgi:large subunit ribosomal protein L27
MASKKAGGTAKNLRDSNPKYLGVKVNDGEGVKTGEIIVRQRGTVYMAGKNVSLGKDYTIFATKDGKVEFKDKRKLHFDGSKSTKKIVHVQA